MCIRDRDAYRETVKGAVGGAAGVTHESVNAHTCLLYTSIEPNTCYELSQVIERFEVDIVVFGRYLIKDLSLIHI